MKTSPIVSFVLSAYNEEGSLAVLHEELLTECAKLKLNYEILIVDDGSNDMTFEIAKKLAKSSKQTRVVKLRGNWGKATALRTGFRLAKGEIIATLDADLQDNPADLGKFLEKLSAGYDLVVGWKKVRHDPVSKLISTRLFNYAVQKFTGLSIHDVNCGFKVFKKNVATTIPVYGDLFRLFPVIAHKQNFKVGEVTVNHRKRKFGKSKFGLERSLKGGLDLITVVFLTGYLSRPGHFFGGFGMLSFGSGFMIGLYITYLRITTGTIQYRHPLLFFGMLLMIIGVQLITTGLVAEMIVNLDSRHDDVDSKIHSVV